MSPNEIIERSVMEVNIMKKNISIKLKRLVAIIMSLVMCMSSNIAAFAAETEEFEMTKDSGKKSKLEVITEESPISREEALECLGITEEELGDGQLYIIGEEIPISTLTRSTTVFSPGDVHQFGPVTFTGSNVGSALLAFNASKVKIAVVWRWLNPQDRTTVNLYVTLTNSLGTSRIQVSSFCGFGDGDVNTVTSDWENVSSSFTYHFEYDTTLGYWVEDFPTPQITAYVVVGAA